MSNPCQHRQALQLVSDDPYCAAVVERTQELVCGWCPECGAIQHGHDTERDTNEWVLPGTPKATALGLFEGEEDSKLNAFDYTGWWRDAKKLL